MSTRPNDWDREEREALEGLEGQLDAIRRRHRDDPSFELLRAARGDALPGDLQETVSQHLATSPWSRALVDGSEPVEGILEPSAESRVLAGIKKRATHDPPVAPRRWLLPALVGSTLAVGVLVTWVALRQAPTPSRPEPETTMARTLPPAAPSFQLPLDKPDVMLSAAALTWRGAAAENRLLVDLKPAIDAFRQDDYVSAAREFAALENRYPNAVEVFYYGGVSRLFVNDPAGAIAALERASEVADDAFAPHVAWYRAIGEQRAGREAEARAQLTSLCARTGERAARACEALKQFESPDAR